MGHESFKIKEKEQYAGDVYRIAVRAPRIPPKAQAGQFVIVRADEKGERIP